MKYIKILLVGISVALSACSLFAQSIDKGNDLYEIKLPNASIEIDAKSGCRISSLKLNNKEFLYVNKSDGDNWGSTFWTSPQSQWGWPPSVNINKNVYTGGIVGGKVELSGAVDEKLGLSVKKSFQANPADESFIVTYSIINNTKEKKTVAPWEITRVMPGGLTIFPFGDKAKRGDLVSLMKDSIGVTWFAYKEDKIPGGVPKFFGDGSEGWLAQVWNGMVLIKKFEDIPKDKAAPEEAEIELYTNPDKTYIEIEQQGAFKTVEPGAQYNWTVKWYVRSLPPGVKAEIGNEELVRFIRFGVREHNLK